MGIITALKIVSDITASSSWGYLSFLVTSLRPLHPWKHPHAQYVINRFFFWPRKCNLGAKDEIWNVTPLKAQNLQIRTSSWQSMENSNYTNQTSNRCWPPKWHHVTWLWGQKVKVEVNMRMTPTRLPWQRRLPGNDATKSAFYDRVFQKRKRL